MEEPLLLYMRFKYSLFRYVVTFQWLFCKKPVGPLEEFKKDTFMEMTGKKVGKNKNKELEEKEILFRHYVGGEKKEDILKLPNQKSGMSH